MSNRKFMLVEKFATAMLSTVAKGAGDPSSPGRLTDNVKADALLCQKCREA